MRATDTGDIYSMYAMDGTLVYQEDFKRNKRIYHMQLSGDPVAQVEVDLTSGAAANRYIHTDALGSPVVVTNGPHVELGRGEYEPYGLVINRPLRDGPGYTGHVEDASSGLSYMQQRYYDPWIGMFLSVDPVAVRPIGDNFNRYWYANNNPYKFIDLDGREAGCWTQHAGAGCNLEGRDGRGFLDGLLTVLCGCDVTHRAPRGSGEVQSVSAPWEMLVPSRALGVAASRAAQPAFQILEREGNIIIASFKVAAGKANVMTEVGRHGDDLILSGTHIEGSATLKEALQMAKDLGKAAGARRVIIKGAIRTTGARPGHVPKPIVIEIEKKASK